MAAVTSPASRAAVAWRATPSACASHHFQVSKTTRDQRTLSAIQPLDEAARVEEIARMLGGLKLTAATRDHAREMLRLLAR
jgi:DNA repair protein RecN (Recombination protein N)